MVDKSRFHILATILEGMVLLLKMIMYAAFTVSTQV